MITQKRGLSVDCMVENISCDLHQEHLNREVKNAFGGLSSNKSVKRVGKSIKGLSTIAHAFESLPHPSRKPKTKDVKMMVEQLRKTEAFRFHKHFKNFASNPCKKTLKDWMDEHIKKLLSQS